MRERHSGPLGYAKALSKYSSATKKGEENSRPRSKRNAQKRHTTLILKGVTYPGDFAIKEAVKDMFIGQDRVPS